jgi:PEP-CTERM motif
LKKFISLGIVLSAIGMLSASASAGTIDASGVITETGSSTSGSGTVFDYSIVLTNTSGAGNDGIATFWFSWIPGENFMPAAPTTVTPPTGWMDVVTGGSTDSAIQFDSLTPASNLAPGNSLTFMFTSTVTPAELMGKSPAFPTQDVLTSFVYSQGPLQGDGQQILVSFASVPEPSTLTMGLVCLASLAALRLRRKSKGAA